MCTEVGSYLFFTCETFFLPLFPNSWCLLDWVMKWWWLSRMKIWWHSGICFSKDTRITGTEAFPFIPKEMWMSTFTTLSTGYWNLCLITWHLLFNFNFTLLKDVFCFLFVCFFQYTNLQNLTVGNLAYELINGDYTPLTLCQVFYRNSTIDPENDTFDIDPHIDKGTKT